MSNSIKNIQRIKGPFDLPNDWSWVKWGDLIEEYQQGVVRTNRELGNGPVGYLKMGDIDNKGNCSLCNLATTEASHDELIKYKLKEGDFLINVRNTRELVGKTCVIGSIKDDIIFNHMLIRVKHISEIPSQYINAVFQLTPIRQIINSYKKGTTTVIALYKNDLLNLPIPLPPEENLKKITRILKNIESKIEINNKINQELEELGQALYTKWFVNFDFPNEEGKPYKSSGGEMIESELGMIPKGWKVGAIGDGVITKIIGSGINKFESTKKYLATANVSISSIINHEKISYSNRPSRANMQPKSNTVWFAKMKDTKKILSISDFDSDIIDEYIFSTGFAGVECLNDSIYYVWNFINNEKFELTKNSLSNGSTQKSINNENISKIKMIIPTNELLTSYYNLMYNSMKQISLNKLENKKLEELRDFLIPQLMSGNLEIKDIDNTEKEV